MTWTFKAAHPQTCLPHAAHHLPSRDRRRWQGGVRQELPCSSGVRQTAILVHIPGAHHVACPHRYLCKPPHDIPVRLTSTACHDFILPDVDRAIFHAEVKLSNGSDACWPTGKLWTTLISLPKSALCFSYSNEFRCATPDKVSVDASSLLLAPNNRHKKRGPKP